MGRLLTALIDAQAVWSRPLGEVLSRLLRALFHRLGPVRSILNGIWFGHALHPAFTDGAVGAYVVLAVLDLAGQEAAADITLVVALLFAGASAITGLADYSEAEGRTRDQATVHATVMVIATVLYLASLAMRLAAPEGADRTAAVVVALVALVVLTAGAYIGGEVVYRLGNMVNRHAWRDLEDDLGGEWHAVDATAVPDGTPTRARAAGQRIVLVRTGGRLHALHDVCAHYGCSLAGTGKVVGDALRCECHGSTYRLRDGAVVAGPSTFDQPAYEVREMDGRIEVRLVSRP